MPIVNTDTQTSPGIGELPAGFGPLGGCLIDVVGINGVRLTALKAAGAMFQGWTGPDGPTQAAPDPTRTWLVIATNLFDGAQVESLLGGGIVKANIRITAYDGDSASPNPVYEAMFGSGNFPYSRWSPQPGNYDFDGGQNLWLGFEDVSAYPIFCAYMGETTTYRLDGANATVDTFTGFPGVYGLTDYTNYPLPTRPPEYMPPFAVTGWFQVPAIALAALYAVMLTGVLKIGIHDITGGDQYYDFTLGLPEEPPSIPILPACPVGNIAF